MSDLDRPIGKVFRRLRAQRFLTVFVVSAIAWLGVATVVLAIDVLARPLPGPTWLPFAIAGGMAWLTAVIVAAFTGPTRIDAARAIDRAFDLNDRLGSTLTLPDDLRSTSAGRALREDTIARLAGLDVSRRFGLKLPRQAWLNLLPLGVAGVILLLPEWLDRPARAKSNATTVEAKADRKEVVKQSELLKDRIAAQRKEMDKAKFGEAEKLLAEVEKAAEQLAKAPPADKDKALVSLNKLSEALKQREKALGSPEQIAKGLQQLKETNPTSSSNELVRDLAKGDFAKAADDLEKAQEKLASGKMTETEKKALKEKVEAASKALQGLANMEKRREQLEQARKNGGLTEEQFKAESAKLEQQKQGMENLAKLAEQLEKASEQLGDSGKPMTPDALKKAAESLGMSQQQMEQLAQQVQELQALEGAAGDIQAAKDGMNGSEGANQFGQGLGSLGQGSSRGGEGDGQGRGRGQGKGDRAIADDETSFYGTKSKGQNGPGKAIFEGSAPPQAQIKGTVKYGAQAEGDVSSGNAADSLTNQKIPRSVEKHVQGYFDRINGKE